MNRNRPRGFVIVPASDNAFGVEDNCTVVEKDVDVVLGSKQGADIALQYKVGLACALDGFGNVGVGGVNEFADLFADCLLPIGERVNVIIHAWVYSIIHSGLLVADCQNMVLLFADDSGTG